MYGAAKRRINSQETQLVDMFDAINSQQWKEISHKKSKKEPSHSLEDAYT